MCKLGVGIGNAEKVAKKNVGKLFVAYKKETKGGTFLLGLRRDIKRTNIYLEFDEISRKKWFEQKKKKYLHNIDTFYYSISIKDDSNNDDRLDDLFIELDNIKDVIRLSKGEIQETYEELNVKLGTYGIVYNYRLQEPDLYDIYIGHYLPNINTPRIVVQLRSYGLWIYGIEEMIYRSYEKAKYILKKYNCDICRTKENRIDFAYHTNSILNPYKFFSDRNLDKYLYTNLEKYYKIGDIRKKRKKVNDESNNDCRFTLDYFALGQLKSNNIYNRNYNKVKEVIEQNYKAFFFDLWFKNGLISLYDKYCFEYAYNKKNYNAIEEGRLNFYLEHGSDPLMKKEIKLLLDKDSRYEDLKKLADKITPKTTLIMNIEFQTKRKFYYYADKEIELLPVKNKNMDSELKRLFKVLDNRKLFLDYITSETIAFIEKIEEVKKDGKKETKVYYQDWWKRLRSVKIESLIKDKKYLRNYNYKRDKEKVIKRAVNSIASNAVYNGKSDSSFIDDVSDLIANINDNDVKKYDICFIDNETGEIIQDLETYNKYLEGYNKYKKKKNKAIKNRIN